MTEHPDVILYLLFESIRGDWSDGIPERALAIKRILPHTSFNAKDELVLHMDNMISSWNYNREWFDGRHWARDGDFCYYTLFKYYDELDILRTSNLLKWGKSDNGEDRLESNWKVFSTCHDDVMGLYIEWLGKHT